MYATAAILALGLGGCLPDVVGMYEAEKSAALARAVELPPTWEADVAIVIAAPAIQRLAEGIVGGGAEALGKGVGISLPLGQSAKLVPRLRAERTVVAPSDECPACFDIDADLGGKVTWSALGAEGSFSIASSVRGVLALSIENGRTVLARVRRVSKVSVQVGGLGALRVDPASVLQGAIESAIAERAPAIRVYEVNTEALPLRDMRLRTDRGAATIELLTDVPGAPPIPRVVAPADGFRAAIGLGTVTGLIRREAFARGKVAHDVAADVRRLDVVNRQFALDLRLWRLVGRGWWRDYAVTGTLAVEQGKLVLEPAAAAPAGASPGAALVDPLAVLAQQAILDGIVRSLRQALPMRIDARAGSRWLRGAPTSATGAEGVLVIDGSIAWGDPE